MESKSKAANPTNVGTPAGNEEAGVLRFSLIDACLSLIPRAQAVTQFLGCLRFRLGIGYELVEYFQPGRDCIVYGESHDTAIPTSPNLEAR